ncbi:hypothetical protein BD626DRAFT_182131 [Schizophyllum amplum]|uniref:Uncharacterized protein n=1 Tax=Schizophyllum amplum TaxID=97359 RepID=A0A550C1I8_9AGAR|nr:hypothetical protein BD626DRAFT_182131 [Auriculariopsis ampla]
MSAIEMRFRRAYMPCRLWAHCIMACPLWRTCAQHSPPRGELVLLRLTRDGFGLYLLWYVGDPKPADTDTTRRYCSTGTCR